MAKTHMSPEDRRAIAEAVGRAEAATAAEIVCVLAPEADDYAEIPVAWAAAAALIVPFLAALAGFHPVLHLPGGAGWEAAGPVLGPHPLDVAAAYAAMQALVFGLVFALLQWPPARRALTPGALRTAKAKKGAASQFMATGLAAAADRTGVLIYAALHDRRVEVVVDPALRQRIGADVWAKAVQAVAEGMRGGVTGGGFVHAVEVCGQALAAHVPPTGPRANAYSDELREL